MSARLSSYRRVRQRVSQGGHDVPPEKINGRYGRVLVNFRRAIDAASMVLFVDNSADQNGLEDPTYHAFRFYEERQLIAEEAPVPAWWGQVHA